MSMLKRTELIHIEASIPFVVNPGVFFCIKIILKLKHECNITNRIKN